MKFSIYDYGNRFITQDMTTSNEIYVGTTAVEKQYGYMRQRPGQPVEGGQLGIPYFAEFRIASLQGTTGDVKLEVEAAPAEMDTDGFPKFTGQTPVSPDATDWKVIGTLTIPRAEALESLAYRVAFSDGKNKWFRVKLTNCKASAFLLRG